MKADGLELQIIQKSIAAMSCSRRGAMRGLFAFEGGARKWVDRFTL
jgi:hypothetical protein